MIIGAGYSGLATAYHLLKFNPHLDITLYDPQGIGGEASKISAGILYKFAGLHAKLNRFGHEGAACTLELIHAASQALGRSVILSDGVVRPALTDGQLSDYKKCAENFPDDVTWIHDITEIDPNLPLRPGIFIKSGLTIDTQGYLEGLFKACTNLKFVQDYAPNDPSSIVIYATGATSSTKFPELKIGAVKGQLLELEWPKSLPPLKHSIVSTNYICMHKDNTRCLVGATYEHTFDSPYPDEKAIQELLPKAIALYPALKDAPVVDVKAGLRATTPTHLPLIKQLSKNEWIITGLGSKGMLYHSLYAKKLVELIFSKHD